MARENKFRGRRLDKGELVKGYLLKSSGKTFIVVKCETDFEGYATDLYAVEWYEVDPETVGEFTELKDKNGVEIYEGDICFDGTHYAVVIFQDGCFYLKYSFGMGYLFREIKNIEVVGSIWTTPELLND